MSEEPTVQPLSPPNGTDPTQARPKPPKCPECRATDGGVRSWPSGTPGGTYLTHTCLHCGVIFGVQFFPAVPRVQPSPILLR